MAEPSVEVQQDRVDFDEHYEKDIEDDEYDLDAESHPDPVAFWEQKQRMSGSSWNFGGGPVGVTVRR